MPTTRRSRELHAPIAELWEIVGDPFHLPRWWPRVQRVEGFDGERFTQVMSTSKGKAVRGDFRLVESEVKRTMIWEQDVANTPFERILKLSRTEVHLDAQGDGVTRVELVLTQQLKGMARYGGMMMRGATKTTLDDALSGLWSLVEP